MANASFLAADVGNSRIKIGRFEATPAAGELDLPIPVATVQLPVRTSEDRLTSLQRLREWLDSFAEDLSPNWYVASVNRTHAAWLEQIVFEASPAARIHRLTHQEIPLAIHVEAPDRVGVDRLAGAAAAHRLHAIGAMNRPSIVVDFGTAITVDLVSAEGAFEGGAILPGIAMAAEALESQTDALPRSPLADLTAPPSPVGKSTLHAIEAGLLWGAVGAVRELIGRMARTCGAAPLVILTGGASPAVVPLLQSDGWLLVHVPELVLAGIAIVAQGGRESFWADRLE